MHPLFLFLKKASPCYNHRKTHHTEDVMSYSDTIIDISYTTIITGTFDDVRDAGIHAVMHKAGYGLKTPDPGYLNNRDKAMEAGLLWGAYHVGTKTGSGKEQAGDFLATVRAGSPKAKTLLALDFERNEKNWTNSMTPEQAEDFVSSIHAQTGIHPVVYGRGTLARSVEKNPGSLLTKCPLWLAHYDEYAPTPPSGWDRCMIWQYTEKGSVGKAIAYCDRDRFNGTVEELQRFWDSHSI